MCNYALNCVYIFILAKEKYRIISNKIFINKVFYYIRAMIYIRFWKFCIKRNKPNISKGKICYIFI